MSSEKSREKKPFLKKGTRQFLSNAQVRSQTTKPKIVDFGTDEQLQNPTPILRSKASQNIDPNCEDIKIKVSTNVNKQINPARNYENQPKKVDRVPPIPKNAEYSANKPKRQSSIGKKKEAALSDYIDNQSGVGEQYYVKKVPLQKQQPFLKKQQPRKVEQQRKVSRQPTRPIQLVQQKQQQDSQEQEKNAYLNDSFKPITNTFKKKEDWVKNKLQQNQHKQKQKDRRLQYSDEDEEKEKINFVSDNQSDEEAPPRFKKDTISQKAKQIYKEQVDEYQPVSKVKMNYFNKGGNSSSNKLIQENKEKQKMGKKPLSITDIPKQLKEQIVKEAIAQKEQQLHSQLQKLREKFAIVKKQKEKVDEDNKNLAKAKIQFEKQMEQKNRELEEKIKNQNSKLAREKKYMKDAQMAGQGDRKWKNEVEELRKLLQKEKEEKRKMQAKYKMELQNLRKKLADQSNNNKLLSEQMKLLQYGQIIQKEKLQEISKEQKKSSIPTLKSGFWSDAPQTSYVFRFQEDGFSLIEMDLQKFHYEQNQYFQYYMKTKDSFSPLDFQTADQDRAKRQYKNGKIQVQQFQKFLKEIYPFNYTIVFLYNGDIKQTIPQGIVIYFSSSSGVTQYCFKKGHLEKQIVYFPSSETVQMKVTNHANTKGNYTQVYSSGHLKRTLSDGTVILQKRDHKGKIVSMPASF